MHQLKAIFPAWTAALKTPELESEARRQWLQGLLEAGINSDVQIRAGLARCRAHSSPFLPSVGEFVQWCQEAGEQASGLPSESSARLSMNRELARPAQIRNWAQHHPAVFWVYSQLGSFEWKTMDERKQRQAFSEIWAEVRSMAKNGFDFSAVLPAPGQVADRDRHEAVNPETARGHCADILSMFSERGQDDG